MSDDLESLLAQLEPEPPQEIDWDAPESGQFPPQVQPGPHEFVFHLNEQKAFDLVKVQDHPYLTVIWDAEVRVPDSAEPKLVKFLRASSYKPQGRNSDMGELFRCLNVKPESGQPRDMSTALKQADGRAGGSFVLGWERYCKTCDQRVSTNPRKRKKTGRDDVAWPRDAQGKPELAVKCPLCGDPGYGREFVVTYKLPPRQQ